MGQLGYTPETEMDALANLRAEIRTLGAGVVEKANEVAIRAARLMKWI
jgi:hypothetical protein